MTVGFCPHSSGGMWYYMEWFLYFELALHSGINSHWSWCIILSRAAGLGCSHLRGFVSPLVRGVCLSCSWAAPASCGSRGNSGSVEWVGTLSFLLYFWEACGSYCRLVLLYLFGETHQWIIWGGLFFVGGFRTTNTNGVLVVGPFRLPVSLRSRVRSKLLIVWGSHVCNALRPSCCLQNSAFVVGPDW